MHPQSRNAVTRLKVTQNVETCAHTSLTYRNLLHDDEPSSPGVSMFTPTEPNPRHVEFSNLGSCLSHRMVSDVDVHNGTMRLI